MMIVRIEIGIRMDHERKTRDEDRNAKDWKYT